jgi:hypothetical protein
MTSRTIREANEVALEHSDEYMETMYGPRLKGTAGERFSPEQREHHRSVIAHKVLLGYNMTEIAKELGISRGQVAYDLRIVTKRWKEAAVRDFDEARGVELAKIDALEKEAWMAWERSKEKKTQSRQRIVPKGKDGIENNITGEIKTEERDGDPRFLDIVFRCVERRIKLYGLDEAEKIAMVGQFQIGEHNDLTRRVERYNSIIETGSVTSSPALAIDDHTGQSVDSERSPRETSSILDID